MPSWSEFKTALAARAEALTSSNPTTAQMILELLDYGELLQPVPAVLPPVPLIRTASGTRIPIDFGEFYTELSNQLQAVSNLNTALMTLDMLDYAEQKEKRPPKVPEPPVPPVKIDPKGEPTTQNQQEAFARFRIALAGRLQEIPYTDTRDMVRALANYADALQKRLLDPPPVPPLKIDTKGE